MECEGSINIMTAREKMRLATEAGDKAAYKAAWEDLIRAQGAHRSLTGCTKEH
jgi:hypothetical protein